MNGPGMRLTAILLAAAMTGPVLISGCGGNDTEKPATDAPGATSTPDPGSVKPDGSSGPASAGDARGPAPDDAISERPGGPKPPGSPEAP